MPYVLHDIRIDNYDKHRNYLNDTYEYGLFDEMNISL